MRVAIAGLGGAAMRGHLPAIGTIADRGTIELVGATDPSPVRREVIASMAPDVPSFRTADEMLEAVDSDLLAIATEPSAHARLISLGLSHGVHVLCEKPLAASEGDLRLIGAAHEARPDLAIVSVHQYRYSPTWTWLSYWLRFASRQETKFALTVDVERAGTDRHAASKWRSDIRTSGGMVADHAVHFLALGWTISEALEVVASNRTWETGGAERSSVIARIGPGMLEIRLDSGASARRTRLDARLLNARLAWDDATATLTIDGKRAFRHCVDALSDRAHVDGLYVPLYHSVVANLGDATWRRRRTAETLAVAHATIPLLDHDVDHTCTPP